MKANPKQIEIWKDMSLSKKYELLAATVRQARQLKRMGIKLKKPDASAEQIEKDLAHTWLHARP